MMKIKFKHLFSLGLIALFILRCAPEHKTNKDYEDALKTKKNVKDNLKEIVEVTETLQNQVESLEQAYSEVVEVATKRDFVSLQDVANAKGVSNKVFQARQFFANMEFQFKFNRNQKDENQIIFNQILKKDVSHFFAAISDLIESPKDIEVPVFSKKFEVFSREAAESQYEKWLFLSALAVGMSQTSESLPELNEIHKERISFYSLIKEALLRKQEFEKGLDVPDYIVEILKFKKEAEFLLQLRHNFYALLLASEFHPNKYAIWSDLWVLDWNLNASHFSIAKHKYFEELMDSGIETQDFINKIGLKVQRIKQVDKIFKSLTWLTEDNTPYQRLISQLGMVPWLDQVEKFRFQIKVEASNHSMLERLILKSNNLTGSTLFVFNVCQYKEERFKAIRKSNTP